MVLMFLSRCLCIYLKYKIVEFIMFWSLSASTLQNDVCKRQKLMLYFKDAHTCCLPSRSVLNRGSYMHDHVLLKLLNELGKRDKMRGLPSCSGCRRSR